MSCVTWIFTFLENLVLNGVDSLFDVGSDFISGLTYLTGTMYTKYVDSLDHPFVNMPDSNCTMVQRLPDGIWEFECFERDVAWGLVTLAIIFLPGLMLYSYLITITTDDEDGDGQISKDEQAPMHYRIAFLLASLAFPATIMCVKVVSLFNHSDFMRTFSLETSTMEVELQSLTQLALQCYIVFKRADRFPTLLQWATIGSSFITTAKGKADEFIVLIEGKDTGKGLKGLLKKMTLLAKYLPYFVSLTIFRVASFSLILVVFHYYSIGLYVLLILSLLIVGGKVAAGKSTPKRSLKEYWKFEKDTKSVVYSVLLPVRSIFTEVTDELQPRTLFQSFWFLFNLLFIAALNYVVNIGGGGFYDFLKLGDVHIIKNRVYFNVAIGAIFFSGGVSFVLFVVQIRKKYGNKYGSSSSSQSENGMEDAEAQMTEDLSQKSEEDNDEDDEDESRHEFTIRRSGSESEQSSEDTDEDDKDESRHEFTIRRSGSESEQSSVDA